MCIVWGCDLRLDCVAADVRAWIRPENIEERLRAVPTQGSAQNGTLYGPGIKVDHEEVLYIALHKAVYTPVNMAAKHLNYGLVYCKTLGKIMHHKTAALSCHGAIWIRALAYDLQLKLAS